MTKRLLSTIMECNCLCDIEASIIIVIALEEGTLQLKVCLVVIH
jgi:hypothetical protein